MTSTPRAIFHVVLATLLCAGAAQAITPMLRELEDAFIRIGEQVRPAVVNVESEQEEEEAPAQGPRAPGLEDFFKYYGIPMPDPEDPRMQRRPVASGSGFVFDKAGHIITNNHVIDGAKSIKVRFFDGKEYAADVVGRDADTDIAVIKLKNAPADLHVAELANSDEVKVGQFAIALGSPRGLEGSLSFGHVSALGRDELRLPITLRFQNFIQTDAAINFGNSGGPLVDIDGRVIGMNTAIDAVGESLGFAIPINMVKEVAPQLIASGKVTRGFLGVIGIMDIKDIVTGTTTAEEFAEAIGLPDTAGAYVNGGAIPDSPAEKAGIKKDDVIRKINGDPIVSAQDLVKKVSAMSPGTSVKLDVWREKAPTEIQLTLAEYPGDARKAALGKAFLGMRVQPLTPELKKRAGLAEDLEGMVVMDVEKNSPAYDAEIMQGDIITEVQQNPVKTMDEFRALLDEHAKPGKSVLFRVQKQGGDTLPILVKVPEAGAQ
ncbi:MAG: trypsin-like peptidase domain-containing protein [Candidatus Hydrogenedentes bacterium]|nr:trypsin-like peptidase domain-containing protein [Candidatus Hydrogenedentota bacterium]